MAQKAVEEAALPERGRRRKRLDNDLLLEALSSVNRIVKMIADAKQAASNLKDFAKNASKVADQLSLNIQQLAAASQQVSEGAQRLSQLAEQSAKSMNALSSLLNETAKASQTVNATAQEVLSRANQVVEAGSKARRSINVIRDGIENVLKAVENMTTILERVGKLTGAITDVAGQTNMLALNAAIEAARAGEAGRGFAVVADAVKNLATQSRETASEAESLINETKTAGTAVLNLSLIHI